MALNIKQEKFVEYYIIYDGNGTKAAIAAGYSERTAPAQASRLLNNVEVRTRIRARTDAQLEALKMDANEVLRRLAEVARGAMPFFASVDPDGNISLGAADIAKAQKNLHLVKKVTNTPTDSGMKYEIEVLDPLSALTTLAKHHGLMEKPTVSEVSVTTGSATIQIINRPARAEPPTLDTTADNDDDSDE